MRNTEVLQIVKEEGNKLYIIKRRKTSWIGHIFHRNCFLKHVTEGRIQGRTEVTGRQGRRCMQLLNDLKEMRGYWNLKDRALDCTPWRTHLGRGYGPVVKTDYKMNEHFVYYVSVQLQDHK
jgi:hypothetical protein